MPRIKNRKQNEPRIWALAICVLALTACSSHEIGGRPFPIQIDSLPTEGATAYLVPNTDWLANGMETLDPTNPRFQKFVDGYKVTEGKTPVTTYAPSYQMMVVVSYKGKYVTSRQPVVPGEVGSINVAVDNP